MLRVEGLAKAYDRPLFGDLTFDILRGQRWGLLGPNGSGKTTLLRCLLGLLPPEAGRAALGQGVEVGYFDQQLAGLDANLPAADAIRPPQRDFPEQKRRDLLARFGLTGDTALQPVGQLSGGERCRAALARLAALDANFLVLDEPTNHLDLWAREALEQALAEFAGTVLFVTHDRYFADRVADHLLILRPEGVRIVEGNYHTYHALLQTGPPEAPQRPVPPRTAAAAGKAAAGRERRSKPAPSKRRFPYRKVTDLEAEIFRRETRLKEIHETLAQPDTHRDGSRVRQLKAEISEHTEALAVLYEHWEEASQWNA